MRRCASTATVVLAIVLTGAAAPAAAAQDQATSAASSRTDVVVAADDDGDGTFSALHTGRSAVELHLALPSKTSADVTTCSIRPTSAPLKTLQLADVGVTLHECHLDDGDVVTVTVTFDEDTRNVTAKVEKRPSVPWMRMSSYLFAFTVAAVVAVVVYRRWHEAQEPPERGTEEAADGAQGDASAGGDAQEKDASTVSPDQSASAAGQQVAVSDVGGTGEQARGADSRRPSPGACPSLGDRLAKMRKEVKQFVTRHRRWLCTPLPGLGQEYDFTKSWASNATLVTGAFAAFFGASNVLKALLGRDEAAVVGLLAVSAALSAGLTTVASLVVVAMKNKDQVTPLGLLSAAVVTLTAAGGQLGVIAWTGLRLDGLGVLRWVAVILGVIGALLLVVYACRSLSQALRDGMRTPEPAESVLVECRRPGAGVGGPGAAPDRDDTRNGDRFVIHIRPPGTASRRRSAVL